MANFLLSSLSGILIGLSFFPQLTCLSFVGLLPLLYVWENATSKPQSFLYGWVAYAVGICLGFHWLHFGFVEYFQFPHILAALFAVFIASTLALIGGIQGYLYFLLKKKNKLIAGLVSWLMIAQLFQWLLPIHFGYWSAELATKSYLPWLGSQILGLWPWLLQSAILFFIFDKNKKYLIPVGLFILFVIVSPKIIKEETLKKIKILVIQGNSSPREKLQATEKIDFKIENLDRYFRITRQALAEQKPDLVVWPETALPIVVGTPEPLQKELNRFVDSIQVPLLTGGYKYDSNVAMLWEPSFMEPTQITSKKHLVPFAESYIVDQTKLMMLSSAIFNVQICYDLAFPLFSKNYDLLIQLSNDQWFGEGLQLDQHLALAKLRALEANRPLIRSTNTGWSGYYNLVDPVHYLPKKMESFGFYEVDIAKNKTPSFYQRWGFYFDLLTVLLAWSYFIYYYRKNYLQERSLAK